MARANGSTAARRRLPPPTIAAASATPAASAHQDDRRRHPEAGCGAAPRNRAAEGGRHVQVRRPAEGGLEPRPQAPPVVELGAAGAAPLEMTDHLVVRLNQQFLGEIRIDQLTEFPA